MKKIRHLSEKESLKRRLILKATEDYFGERIEEGIFGRVVKAVRNKSTLGLNEEERKAAWTIQTNLTDEVYIASLQVPISDVA